MCVKYLIILIISVLILNACGVKGPVKPVKPDSSKLGAVNADSEVDKKPGSCGN